jgi:predicted Zn-dependent peptidase
MLKDNTDEAFDLLRMALTSPHFESADVERVRAQILSGLRRDSSNPSALATRKFLEVTFGDHVADSGLVGRVLARAAAEGIFHRHQRYGGVLHKPGLDAAGRDQMLDLCCGLGRR